MSAYKSQPVTSKIFISINGKMHSELIIFIMIVKKKTRCQKQDATVSNFSAAGITINRQIAYYPFPLKMHYVCIFSAPVV